MKILREMETDGAISLRGLWQDATLFDEIIIDVNTMYFERKGVSTPVRFCSFSPNR